MLQQATNALRMLNAACSMHYGLTCVFLCRACIENMQKMQNKHFKWAFGNTYLAFYFYISTCLAIKLFYVAVALVWCCCWSHSDYADCSCSKQQQKNIHSRTSTFNHIIKVKVFNVLCAVYFQTSFLCSLQLKKIKKHKTQFFTAQHQVKS